ncbi:MAG: sensor histidine kinase [Bacteroidota bacterium]
MKSRTIIYWSSQITGWGLFVLGNVIMAALFGFNGSSLVLASLKMLVFGITLSHILKILINRWGWKQLSLLRLAPRILLSSLVMGFLFVVLSVSAADLLIGRLPFFEKGELRLVLLNAVNLWVVFLIWQIIYFALHTFRNWKLEEIKNLELKAANTEIELNSFKAQLNPHFIFNALNSIRALVDEAPDESKRAINMLSGILRGSLMLGRYQVVPLREELEIVEKYLFMERIRFEERLRFAMDVDPDLLAAEVPPFMIQTLVENGVKHGISKLQRGGELRIRVTHSGGQMRIEIRNTGFYRPIPGREGIGISNTLNRLRLIFGDRASLSIRQEGDEVVSELVLPIQTTI